MAHGINTVWCETDFKNIVSCQFKKCGSRYANFGICRKYHNTGVAFAQGHAGIARPSDLLAHVRASMYEPAYTQYA